METKQREIKQRELKFRFWSGEKMFYLLDNVMECLKQQMAFDQNFKKDIQYDHVGLHGARFMQFIGLLDKNGKEIYEDDIVKFINHTGESEKCLPIKFDPYRGFRPYLKGYGGFEWSHLHSEVIGNIYQTPDLIK